MYNTYGGCKYMQNVTNALLNCLTVSIPEEIVWFFLTMILLKRFDLLDRYRWKENIKWLLIPVIPTAISINLFRYILSFPKIYMFFVTLSLFIILISYVIKKTKRIEEKYIYLKVILYSFIGITIVTLTECFYMPIILYIMKINITQANNNISINFLLSLPERVFQILLIIILLNRNSSSNTIYIFKYREILVTATIFIGIILFSLISIIRAIGQFNLLINLSLWMQVLVGVTLVLIPTVLVSVYFLPINFLIDKLNKTQQSYENILDD